MEMHSSSLWSELAWERQRGGRGGEALRPRCTWAWPGKALSLQLRLHAVLQTPGSHKQPVSRDMSQQSPCFPKNYHPGRGVLDIFAVGCSITDTNPPSKPQS